MSDNFVLASHRAGSSNVSRHDFPDEFIFGASTSSYQIEGAAKQGGRGRSIWDTFTHRHPDKIEDGSNGDLAINSYHLYKEDVKIMKLMGLDAYRFSLSWPRILPTGRKDGGVNREGVDYYNNLIDELLANDIEPFVTLFHWDVPQQLQDEYGGFLDEKIVDDFCDFVEVCFWEFGDRVKNWITFNEPYSFCSFCNNVYGTAPARDTTAHPTNSELVRDRPVVIVPIRATTLESVRDRPVVIGPTRVARLLALNCVHDDGVVVEEIDYDKYKVGHNQLLAHAKAADLYRKRFQNSQKGKLGMSLLSEYFEPLNEKRDVDAAKLAFDFLLGWFMEPLTFGHYPQSMIERLGSNLPTFKKHESDLLIGSCDFIGVNYYTAVYASKEKPPHEKDLHPCQHNLDSGIYTTPFKKIGDEFKPIGPKYSSGFIYSVPEGLYHVLVDIKHRYRNPIIYITEMVLII